MNFEEKLEALRINIESLHANLHELFESTRKHDDQIADLTGGIANLLTIAQIQNERIKRLEDKAGL